MLYPVEKNFPPILFETTIYQYAFPQIEQCQRMAYGPHPLPGL